MIAVEINDEVFDVDGDNTLMPIKSTKLITATSALNADNGKRVEIGEGYLSLPNGDTWGYEAELLDSYFHATNAVNNGNTIDIAALISQNSIPIGGHYSFHSRSGVTITNNGNVFAAVVNGTNNTGLTTHSVPANTKFDIVRFGGTGYFVSYTTDRQFGTFTNRYPLISNFPTTDIRGFDTPQAFLEDDFDNNIVFTTDGSETFADLEAQTGTTSGTYLPLGDSSFFTYTDTDLIQAGTYSVNKSTSISQAVKQISVHSEPNEITQRFQEWTLHSGAESVESAVINNEQVVVLSKPSGSSSYYRAQESQVGGVDDETYQFISILRNAPDINLSLIHI